MIEGSALLRSLSPTGCSVFLPIICTVVLYCLRVCLRAVHAVRCAGLVEGFGALYALGPAHAAHSRQTLATIPHCPLIYIDIDTAALPLIARAALPHSGYWGYGGCRRPRGADS